MADHKVFPNICPSCAGHCGSGPNRRDGQPFPRPPLSAGRLDKEKLWLQPGPTSLTSCVCSEASKAAPVVKNLPANAGDVRDTGSILGLGNGNPLQYSCLENPMDRVACWAMVHGVAKSQTRLQLLSMHAHLETDCSPLTRQGAPWAPRHQQVHCRHPDPTLL